MVYNKITITPNNHRYYVHAVYVRVRANDT